MDKQELRQVLKQRLNDTSLSYRKEASLKICEKLLPYLSDKMIFSYAPFGTEVDVSLINERFQVAYPLLLGKHQMEAYMPKNGSFFVNDYGFKEPLKDDAILIPKEKIDIVIVPMLGFNEELYRLGRGGGYYDVYLQDSEAFKIGVAYSIQKTDQLQADPFDIALDMIITEEEILTRT